MAYSTDYPDTDNQITTWTATLKSGPTGTEPCRAIIVGTSGVFTWTNPDGTTVSLPLTQGYPFYMSTKTALTGSGTILYGY